MTEQDQALETEETSELTLEKVLAELEGKIVATQGERDRALAAINQMEGALQAFEATRDWMKQKMILLDTEPGG